VYFKQNGTPTYSDPSVDVGDDLSITLPSDIPASSSWYGNYTIGITAYDAIGNESNMSLGSSFFDFVAPDAPGLVQIS